AQQSGLVPSMGGSPYASMTGPPVTTMGAYGPPQSVSMGSMAMGSGFGAPPQVSGGDWFSRLDKDGSGALSREEFAQAQQSGLVPSMGGSPYASMTGPPVTTMGAPATYGPPQSVSMGSMAMGSGFGAPPQVSGGDWFSRLDKDGSGALSREEFA
ncbi:unnamed protein product, partial [Durusdinium trenchii]